MSGRVALISGGASGIGLATAERWAADGGRVAIADIAPDGESAAQRIGASYVHLDVGALDAWEKALATVVGEYGRLDLLHLNAGIQTPPIGAPIGDDPFRWVTEELYRRVMHVNAAGVLNGILAARNLPEDQQPKDIVVTASIAGLVPIVSDPLYSMSKHAVIGLVRSLAPTMAEAGTRLQAICPGGTDTQMPAPDMRIPGREFAPPGYIADAVVHALNTGKPGDIWMATDADIALWTYEFAPVRK